VRKGSVRRGVTARATCEFALGSPRQVVQSKESLPRPVNEPGVFAGEKERAMADHTELAELRTQLEAERARLEAEIAENNIEERETQSEATGENVYRDHMADQGSATFEREMDMTFLENERDELERVKNAIARLDAGTYGVCQRCGDDIPLARLEAVPTASLCIQCKEAEETR
jgi:DnaK suppressor protein